MTGPLDITVSTTVVATVSLTPHVTKRRVNVTGGVNRDIPMKTATKVNLNINFDIVLQIFVFSFITQTYQKLHSN